MELVIKLEMIYMYRKKEIGNFGEELACKYLKNYNYVIMERNFNCHQGEIDIIAFDKSTKEIVFFEVKTRTNFNYGYPSDAIDKTKIKHLKNSIEYYLYKRRILDKFIRIDVIEIVINKSKYKLNHLKQVEI